MKRFKKPLLAISILLIAAFAIDLVYLNHLINKRIMDGILRIPSSLYGRKVEIKEGDNIHNRFIFNYLDILKYGEREGNPEKGEFARQGGTITVNLKDVRDEKTLHRGFKGTIRYDEETGDIESIETGGVPIDTLILGIPEIGKVADRKKEIRKFISIGDIPPHLIDAVIAAEDRRFFRHIGIDYRAIFRALSKDLTTMSFREGGSTITQQLARNFFLSLEKTISRKIQETFIALILELKYSKMKILELYLNQIYLGQRGSEGIYGVGEASAYYFAKNAGALTLSESIMIASLIKSPNFYSPLRHPKRISARMNYVVGGMLKMGTITEEKGEEALAKPPPLHLGGKEKSAANYFTDTIIDMISDKIDNRDIFYGGYHIYTTLDPVIQDVASTSLSLALERIEKKYGLEKRLQGAVVILDNSNGEVLALVGGRSYSESQFNRATMARRQVGSLFKPFVVLSAVRNGVEGKPVTLATIVDGKGVSAKTEEGLWVPQNFENKEYGEVTVRNILEFSINTGAVALGLKTGLDNIVNTGFSFGLGEWLKPYPSMILGTFSFTPVDMAYAYAAFTSGGLKYPLRIIKNVSWGGKNVITFPSLPIRIIKPEEAYLIIYALTGTIERGTGKALGAIFPEGVAGKTGTTDDGRDSWFVAMTKDYTICTWVGFDDASPSPLTGATGALPVSAQILKKLHRGSSPGKIQVPSQIITRKVDYNTGFLATSGCDTVIEEAFMAGTEPQNHCPLHPQETVEKVGTKILEMLRGIFKSK